MTDQNQQARNMMGSMANEVYEASVGARALARAGANPQLKGIAHEMRQWMLRARVSRAVLRELLPVLPAVSRRVLRGQ